MIYKSKILNIINRKDNINVLANKHETINHNILNCLNNRVENKFV